MSLFTILPLFYVFEFGNTKNATQSLLTILTLNGLFLKKFQILNKASPLEAPHNRVHPSEILKPETRIFDIPYPLNLPPPPLLFVFFHYSVCIVISDCTHLCDTGTFTHTASREKIYCNWIYIFNKTIWWYKSLLPNFSAGNSSVIFFNRFLNVYNFLTDAIL